MRVLAFAISTFALAAPFLCVCAIVAPLHAQATAIRVRDGGLSFTEVLVLTAAEGGPETGRGVVAVSRTGNVAFTYGSDDKDRHVTVVDSAGRIVTRVGGRGAGPGEFQSVFNVFIDDRRVVLAGVGQVSAFNLNGKHMWSRAIPPNYLAVALLPDSIDLVDITYVASGRQVGEFRRHSTALGGGGRTLVAATDRRVQALAKSVSDEDRFVRLAFASTGEEVVLGNGFTYRLLRMNAAGATLKDFGLEMPVMRPTEKEVEAEVAKQVEMASRPFKLPDGSVRRNRVPLASIRKRAEAPQAYFSARAAGLHLDPATGDVYVVETHHDTVKFVRIHDGSMSSVQIPCDPGTSMASVRWPFVALICSGTDAGTVELRLYKIKPER